MKKLIKILLGLIGLEISKKKSIRNNDGTFETFFAPIRNDLHSFYIFLKNQGFYPDLVVDIGVAYGTPELTGVFDNSYFIWVEPLVEFEEVLKNLSARYRGEFFLVAAGKQQGKMVLNVHEDLAGSSFLFEVDGKSADGVRREVSVVELDTLVKDKQKKNVLLKIDVQGAELDVLDGSQELLKFTEVIVLEVSMFKFQFNSPDFYEVVAYMKNKGFVVYDVFHGHNRPLDDALAQVDLVFVKENGQFRTNHNWATIEQRKQINKIT